MTTTFNPNATLRITQTQLAAAIATWERQARAGEMLPAEEAQALPVEEAAASGAAHLWNVLESHRSAVALYHGTPVEEFHAVFGHPVEACPMVPSIEQRLLRVRLIGEELTEFARACNVAVQIDRVGPGEYTVNAYQEDDSDSVDLVEAADGLGDLRYLVDGGNLIFGFPGEQILAEIHRSNMSKAGADGKPINREDGKTLKGPNYTPPDVRTILHKAQIGTNAAYIRDDAACAGMLELVGYDVGAGALSTWTHDQVADAHSWATAVHLHASDNDDIVVPKRPAHLPEPHDGPMQGDGVFASNPTPLRAPRVSA